jgi:hypothetical protein
VGFRSSLWTSTASIFPDEVFAGAPFVIPPEQRKGLTRSIVMFFHRLRALAFRRKGAYGGGFRVIPWSSRKRRPRVRERVQMLPCANAGLRSRSVQRNAS